MYQDETNRHRVAISSLMAEHSILCGCLQLYTCVSWPFCIGAPLNTENHQTSVVRHPSHQRPPESLGAILPGSEERLKSPSGAEAAGSEKPQRTTSADLKTLTLVSFAQ